MLCLPAHGGFLIGSDGNVGAEADDGVGPSGELGSLRAGGMISIVCHNLSINSVGRAYILAKALQRYYKVQIVGHASSGGIWEPLRDDTTVDYRVLDMRAPTRAARQIDGDVLIASKTRGASFGYALLAKRLRDRPLILDIDDWDLAFFLDYSVRQKVRDVGRLWNADNALFTWLLEKLTHRADGLTVSNTFLQRKFGGTLIPHFRDTTELDPARFDPQRAKSELGLSDRKVVLFLGTPRRHKGVDDLITAVERLGRNDTTLLVVGADEPERRRLRQAPFLKVLGPQPFSEIPRFLSAADVVAVFQSGAGPSRGQLPAKVFDAMSMGVPVVASGVSDLPSILEGCGVIVDAGDVDALARQIGALLADPQYAASLGRRARERCVAQYSYDAVAPALHAVVEQGIAATGQ